MYHKGGRNRFGKELKCYPDVKKIRGEGGGFLTDGRKDRNSGDEKTK